MVQVLGSHGVLATRAAGQAFLADDITDIKVPA